MVAFLAVMSTCEFHDRSELMVSPSLGTAKDCLKLCSMGVIVMGKKVPVVGNSYDFTLVCVELHQPLVICPGLVVGEFGLPLT